MSVTVFPAEGKFISAQEGCAVPIDRAIGTLDYKLVNDPIVVDTKRPHVWNHTTQPEADTGCNAWYQAQSAFILCQLVIRLTDHTELNRLSRVPSTKDVGTPYNRLLDLGLRVILEGTPGASVSLQRR